MSSAEKIGIDIGKSSYKFASRSGVGEIASFVARGQFAQVDGSSSVQPCMIRHNNADWILGEEAVLGTSFGWATDDDKSDERTLLFVLLILARLGVTNAELVVGLPVAAAGNAKKVESVKAMLSGAKLVHVDNKPFTCTIKASVLAEPLGTYFSLILDEQFRPLRSTPVYNDQIAIIDIGYRTVDIVVLQGGKLSAVKNSTMSGMVNLFEAVWKAVEADHGMLQWRDKLKIYHNISLGREAPLVKVNGEFLHPRIWDKAGQLKARLAKDIVDEVRSTLSSMRPDRMIVTGGGAALLKNELLSHVKDLAFHPNPRFANAIGFYRAAQIMPENRA